MWGSAAVYSGIIAAGAGAALFLKPVRQLHMTRVRALAVAAAGALLAVVGLLLPRRRFAAYWRVIYPGSALIRSMWLRAIARRATNPSGV